MDQILKMLLVMAVSSVKFLAGPPLAYFGQLSGFSFLETNLYCITGASSGVLFFMFISGHINSFTHPFKFARLSMEKKHTRIFIKRNRRIIKFWNAYGLLGIAFLTPVVLSIPIGTLIAVRLIADKKKTFLYLLGSIVLWSLVITSILEALTKIPFADF